MGNTSPGRRRGFYPRPRTKALWSPPPAGGVRPPAPRPAM